MESATKVSIVQTWFSAVAEHTDFAVFVDSAFSVFPHEDREESTQTIEKAEIKSFFIFFSECWMINKCMRCLSSQDECKYTKNIQKKACQIDVPFELEFVYLNIIFFPLFI